MPQTKIINKFGTMIGWNNVTLNLFDRDVEGITEIEYTDEQTKELAYGAGKYPIGKKNGNYSAAAKITLHIEESIALLQSLPPGTRLQDLPPFDVPVVYVYNTVIYKDIIRNCEFINNGRSTSQSDGEHLISYDLMPSHIDYNVQ